MPCSEQHPSCSRWSTSTSAVTDAGAGPVPAPVPARAASAGAATGGSLIAAEDSESEPPDVGHVI